MATKKSTSTTTSETAALEAKVAALEAKLLELTKALAEHEAKSEKEHAELAKKCEAKAQGAGGSDEKLRSELKRYFATLNTAKVATYIPKL